MKNLIVYLLAITTLAATSAVAEPVIATPKSIEPFFEAYCYSCHDTETAKADLNLEGLTRTITDSADALHWQDILDQLNTGEMPPKKKKQPPPEELAKIVGDLTESLQAAQTMLRDSGGDIALRRLNRREYETTIKELMGIRISGEKLPDDPAGRFDTIGQNQSLSAIQLEKYFSFGREAVRMALHWATQPRAESKVFRKNFANHVKSERKIYEILEKIKIVHETDKPYAEVGLSEADWITHNRGTEKYPRHAEYRDRRTMAGYYIDNVDYHAKGRMLPIRNLVNSVGLHFPQDARAHYQLRVSAGVVDGVKHRRVIRMTVPYLGIRLGGANGRPIGSFLVTGSIDQPSTHEMTYHPTFTTRFLPQKPNDARRGITFLEDKRGGPGMATLYQHYRHVEPDAPPETILVEWLEGEGPFYDPKSVFERLVEKYQVATAPEDELDSIVQSFLSDFATAAFRGRAVSDEFIPKLHGYYQARRAEGASFPQAIVDPIAMILSSPRFLFLVEPGEQLDAIALANRLSYFLWSAPPDAELLRLARDGSLQKPEVIIGQVDRMLASPKAEAFFAGFMSQWVHLNRFDEVGLDSKLHLHRTDAMIHAAKREPIAFFKTLVRENLPAANLIDSDFVTVNGVLALNYGLGNAYTGSGFQKIALSGDSPRGGIMTQAAFLSIGTMNNRTSPVIRGSLVKEILLNNPPPPPPPNVPELIAAGVEPLPSVRTLVELHQKKPQCASCHAGFDFIGLGLENFDPIGRWRDEELVSDAVAHHQIKRRPKKMYPIDASGSLPNGETFDDIHGLKAELLKDKRAVAGSVFEGLLCYALGRDASFTDRPIIQAGLDALADDAFCLQDMVKHIVISEPFMRR